jgi:drug/metabolite transporter (DMT)-like permease
MPSRFLPYALLGFTGITWGLTTPLTVLAVSTGYQPFGVIFWQLLVIGVMAGATMAATSRRWPFARRHLGFLIGIVLLGTVFPDYLLYLAAARLPGGVLAIIISMVPMFSLPIALALGFERPNALRTAGALCGALAVALLIGPDTSLPGGAQAGFVFLGLGATALYASQGNFITWHPVKDLNPVEILFASSLIGLVFVTPLSFASGQFVSPAGPWDIADWAVLGTAVFHGTAYGGYFALVARTGPVFTSQVAYLTTGTGVLWSIAILGESYSGWIWSAFLLMLLGMALVQPRPVRSA